ncbi:MAG: hypothetical protein RIB60_05260 [Phycisphaerales bacterium]
MIEPLSLVAPRLITQDPAGGSVPWGTILLAALVAVAIVGAVVLYRRTRDRADHADRAVRRMSRLLGLDERERSALHALSSASEIHASALLISRRAFERAIDASSRSARPPKPAVVHTLAEKLHPGAG